MTEIDVIFVGLSMLGLAGLAVLLSQAIQGFRQWSADNHDHD